MGNKKGKSLTKFIRFAGIGVQLGVTMYLASLLGKKADAYFGLETPWCTLALIVLALVLFIYNLTRQLNKLNNS